MGKKRGLGIILSYTNTFLSMICGLLLSSFLIKKIGSTNYGVYQTMSSFANYLVLLEFGTGTVLTRNLSSVRAKGGSEIEKEKNISTIWTIMSGLSALIVLVSVIFYFNIDTIYANSLTVEQIAEGKRMFVLITVFLLSSFVSQTLNGIVLSYEHYTYSSSISIIRILTRTILLVLLVGRFNSAIIICAVDACLNVIIVIYTFIYCKVKFRVKINYNRFDKEILKASLPLCLALFLQTIVNQSNNIAGKFILGIMKGPDDVTLYSVGLYLYSIFSSLSVIPVSLYVPQVTKDVTLGLEGMDLTKTLVQPSRLIVLVSGSVLFGFFACGRQFISIIYGDSYLLAWIIALILIAPSFINMSNAVVLNVLDVKNKRHIRSYLLMITTMLNIVTTIVGIKHFGIIAAAVSMGVFTLVQVVILNIYYYNVIKIEIIYLFKKTFDGILVFQIIGAIVGFVVGSVISNTIVAFILSGCTYVIIAFGGYFLFGKNEKETKLIRKFYQKIRKDNKSNL